MFKAIDTLYKGYKFRSRLEARWAVFFDALGIEWEYEVEGFEFETLAFGKVRYLPDFYIPAWDKYIEIKPKRKPTEDELKKCLGFVQKAEQTLLLIFGDPWPSDYSIAIGVPALNIKEEKIICSLNMNKHIFSFGASTGSLYLYEVGSNSDKPTFWPLSQPFSAWQAEDGEIGCMWILTNEQLDSENLPIIDDLDNGGIEVIFNHDPIKGYRLDDAYITARQYRFEHRRDNEDSSDPIHRF